MMKRFFILITMLLASYSLVTAQNSVTIKGIITGDTKGFNKVYIYGDGVETDTAIIQNGSFEITFPFSKPVVPLLYSEYEAKTTGGVRPFGIVVDRPGVVYLKDAAIGKGIYTGVISGMKSASDYQTFNQQVMKISKETEAELSKKYGSNLDTKSPEYGAYYRELDSIRSMKRIKIISDYIRANPNAYLSGLLLAHHKSSISASDLDRNYKLLSKTVRESDQGKMVMEYMQGLKRSQIGQAIGDFTLSDPSDQPLSFSEMKGKHVIVDFWASWCGPCIASFPHMKGLYEKYKDKQFEIYSISVDKGKTEWLRELNKHNLPWRQGHDTKNIYSSMFAVNALPTVFLIDPQGKILIRASGLDPSGNGPLDKKLAEVFDSK